MRAQPSSRSAVLIFVQPRQKHPLNSPQPGTLAARHLMIHSNLCRSQGQATTADTLATSVSLPYEWASETAEFGLEFVKSALEIGESLPMIGACFTLCLIIAKARARIAAVDLL